MQALSNQIGQYARKPLQSLFLTDLLKLGLNLNEEKLIKSAQFVKQALPIRLARRVESIQLLPMVVGMNPHLKQIHSLYLNSFQKLSQFSQIQTLDEELKFTDLLSELVDQHTHVIPTLAQGMSECRVFMSEKAMKIFLDQMIQARIGIRVIAEHHLSLHQQFHQKEKDENQTGILTHELSPYSLLKQIIVPRAQEVCEFNMGISPTIQYKGDLQMKFPYISVHLEYILFEVLKNAFRATVEHSKEKRLLEPHPVEIIFSKSQDENEICIRISDRGGGIHPNREKQIWEYSYTTVQTEGDLQGATAYLNAQSMGGPMAGLGYGLPMSRIYAEWMGGALSLQTMYRWGTDVYVRLPSIRIGNLNEKTFL